MKTRRRIVQILVFILFLFLFIKTKYTGKDFLEYPINIFMALDPLIAIGTMISSRTFISGLMYSMLFIIATAILGRFFCGWFCPMGTVLDIFSFSFLKKRKYKETFNWQKVSSIKYYILIFVIIGTVINVQFIWLFDPLSLLFKTFAVSFFPLFDFIIRSIFDFLYFAGAGDYSEPVYESVMKAVLSLKPPFYQLNVFILSFFTMILMLELLGKRFWCRVICPLGGLFELLAIKSFARQKINKEKCNECDLCRKKCKMGDVDCIMCFNCVDVCPLDAVTFDFQVPEEKSKIDLSRRAVITGTVSTLLILPTFKLFSLSGIKSPELIRPPGALPENDFLAKCTRCGECMRVCITNGLHPTFLEAGFYGMWSPKLVPRLGYCEYNCSLCGQACPTGAIEELQLEEKHKRKIGLAYINRNRCIPWAKYTDCLVCEEHCPTPDKAIKFRIKEVTNLKGKRVKIKEPHVIEDLCIGCGICENKCPIEGSAILTRRVVPKDTLLTFDGGY